MQPSTSAGLHLSIYISSESEAGESVIHLFFDHISVLAWLTGIQRTLPSLKLLDKNRELVCKDGECEMVQLLWISAVTPQRREHMVAISTPNKSFGLDLTFLPRFLHVFYSRYLCILVNQSL